jgi:hypothetical protein
MADSEKLDKAIEAVKNMRVPPGPSADLASRTIERLQTASHEPDTDIGLRQRPGWIPGIRRLWPLAAAAMLMVGFFVGRLSQPRSISPKDLASLEQSLYSRLHDSLATEVQAAQVQTYQKVASDVNTVLDHRLGSVAAEVILASNNTTNEVIRDLVKTVRVSQDQQERQLSQFAAALQWVQSDRLRDQAQLNTRVASLAVATQRGFALLAGQQASEEPSGRINQPSNEERN